VRTFNLSLVWLSCLLVFVAGTGSPSVAQGLSGGAMASFGGTIQPSDPGFRHQPHYSYWPIGGIGVSASVGVSGAIGPVVAVCEVSTGRIGVKQDGIYTGDHAPENVLRDTLLSLLAGPRIRFGGSQYRLLVGVSRVSHTADIGDVLLYEDQVGTRNTALTVGADVSRPLNPKLAVVGSARLTTRIDRSEQLREFGVGQTILRLGIGLQVEVSSR
jgi:hypothetical protein